MTPLNYETQAIRAAAILTNAYVAGTVISPFAGKGLNPALNNQLNLLVDFTIGSLTSVSLKVEYSIDGTNWYQETFENVSGATATMSLGVYTFSSTGKYIVSIPEKAAYIRVSAIGTGTVTNSSLQVDAILGTV